MNEVDRIEDAVGDLIDDYDEMSDEFEGDRVETVCDMVVDDLKQLRDDLTDGIVQPARPGDVTTVPKPGKFADKQEKVKRQVAVHAAAQTTEMLFGNVLVGADDEDYVIAVQKSDLKEFFTDGDGYENDRFGPPTL